MIWRETCLTQERLEWYVSGRGLTKYSLTKPLDIERFCKYAKTVLNVV